MSLLPICLSGPICLAGRIVEQRPFGLAGLLATLRAHADAILGGAIAPDVVALAKTLCHARNNRIDAIRVHLARTFPTLEPFSPLEDERIPDVAATLADPMPSYVSLVQLALAIGIAGGVEGWIAADAFAQEDAKPGEAVHPTTLVALLRDRPDGEVTAYYPGMTHAMTPVSRVAIKLGILTPAAYREAMHGILYEREPVAPVGKRPERPTPRRLRWTLARRNAMRSP